MEKHFLRPKGLYKNPLHSHVAVVSTKKIIFLTGQVPRDLDGSIVGKGDMKLQLQDNGIS